MKTYGGVQTKLETFLTSVLDGCEWLASCSSNCFTAGETAADIREVWWVPQSIWTQWRRQKSFTCTENQSLIQRPSHGVIDLPTEITRHHENNQLSFKTEESDYLQMKFWDCLPTLRFQILSIHSSRHLVEQSVQGQLNEPHSSKFTNYPTYHSM
jgi:hypothetical protein